MTLHWWMHWFWITVVTPFLVSLIVVAPLSSAAPFSSPLPELSVGGTLTPLEFSSEEPQFHHDSTLYVALLHDTASPTTFAHDYAEDKYSDTPSPTGLFPIHVPDSISLHEFDDSYTLPINAELTASHVPETEHDEENNTTLDLHDNPINEEMLSSDDPNHEDENPKMFARDISVSSRSGKAIGRDYVPSTSIPEIATTASQVISNRNPFIHKEDLDNSSENVEKVVMPIVQVPVTLPTPTNINTEEKINETPVQEITKEKEEATIEPVTISPSQAGAVVIASTAAPDVAVVSHAETNMPPESTPGQTPEVNSAALPPWVPSFSSSEENAEEAEAEDNLRPELALADQQASPEVEANSEAVTRGRMTAEEGMDASSIVGIVLGFVGLVSIVGSAVGFMLYRRRFLNKPQTLNDKCSNADSSGYIDDTLRVSATHKNRGANGTSGSQDTSSGKSRAKKGQPQASGTLPYPNKDNSEEMYSLDNDSFLNSLEAMTIQNYWTDSVKHTKL